MLRNQSPKAPQAAISLKLSEPQSRRQDSGTAPISVLMLPAVSTQPVHNHASPCRAVAALLARAVLTLSGSPELYRAKNSCERGVHVALRSCRAAPGVSWKAAWQPKLLLGCSFVSTKLKSACHRDGLTVWMMAPAVQCSSRVTRSQCDGHTVTATPEVSAQEGVPCGAPKGPAGVPCSLLGVFTGGAQLQLPAAVMRCCGKHHRRRGLWA